MYSTAVIHLLAAVSGPLCFFNPKGFFIRLFKKKINFIFFSVFKIFANVAISGEIRSEAIVYFYIM